MKKIVQAVALSSLLALAACGGGNSQEAAKEEASDNMSDALANQAENVSDMADDASGNTADSLENQAAALENASEAADESNEQNVADEAQKASTRHMKRRRPAPAALFLCASCPPIPADTSCPLWPGPVIRPRPPRERVRR
jgi:hypothetical protein